MTPTRAVRPNLVLAVVAAAQFMVVLDATVVNVALPTLKREIGFSEQNLTWVINVYTLVFGGFLLLGGRLADRVGRRRLFLTGIALFGVASLICGFANSEGMLLVARGLQGLGGSMVSPAALSITLTTFASGPPRNRALAVWGAIAGAGGAVGLLLGGVIVQSIGWRWIFFINVPIGVAVLLAAPRLVPESRSAAAGRGGYDAGGAMTITVGTIALVYTLIKAESWGWTSVKSVGGFAVSVALIGVFLVIERRHRDPLVPLRIFADRGLTASSLTMLGFASAMFGMFFFTTLYLQQILGYGALRTGLCFLPLSLTSIGASALAARFVDRFTPKPVLLVGLTVVAVGFVLLSRISGHSDYAGHVLPALIVLGAGQGLTFVPLTIAATSRVPAADSGLAAGLINMTLQVGGAIGVAALTSISASRVAGALRHGSPTATALTRGYTSAFTVAAGICLAAAAVTLVLLPRTERAGRPEAGEVEVGAVSAARCPGAPYTGHLARLAARRPR